MHPVHTLNRWYQLTVEYVNELMIDKLGMGAIMPPMAIPYGSFIQSDFDGISITLSTMQQSMCRLSVPPLAEGLVSLCHSLLSCERAAWPSTAACLDDHACKYRLVTGQVGCPTLSGYE